MPIDFSLSPEQHAVRQRARDLAREVLMAARSDPPLRHAGGALRRLPGRITARSFRPGSCAGSSRRRSAAR
jgi:hypothetical protein